MDVDASVALNAPRSLTLRGPALLLVPLAGVRRERCADAQERFLQRCFYTAGPYDQPQGYQDLNVRLAEQEKNTSKVRPTTRLRGTGPIAAAAAWRLGSPPPKSRCGDPVGFGATVCAQPRANRMFFLSIPPNVFVPAAGGAADFCSST